MLIQSFGLFWDRDAVEWTPGRGVQRSLWGRHHQRKPALRLCDAWRQHGLYVLYTHTGPYYVGIARQQALGKRLADHLGDAHEHNWQRFSWFGFLPMTDRPGRVSAPDPDRQVPKTGIGRDQVIKDMEALLIKSMGTFNINNMNFSSATEWWQVPHSEVDTWRSALR